MHNTNRFRKKLVAMNEALVLGSLRQRELAEAAEKLNQQLRAEIDDRKRTDERLRRNEALLSALIAQAPVGVYVIDARLRLQNINPTARLTFKNVRPLLGRNISEILRAVWPRRVADQITKSFCQTLRTGVPNRMLDFSERRRDTGVKEFYEWQIQRVTLPAGDYGVVCFFNNITERKRAEKMRRRVELLTASNKNLKQEIIRREKVELALKKSEQQSRELLEESHHMQQQLRRLSRQLLSAQEEERKRISRELHDAISQTLAGIHVQLAGLKAAATGSAQDLRRSIDRTQRQVEEAINDVHRFAHELRPRVLDDVGLIPAIRTLVKSASDGSGRQVNLSASADIEPVKPDQRTVLFRVAQEALSNTVRHAQASRVEVKIQKLENTICLTIKDNGKGFLMKPVLQAKRTKRLGLLGMRERLEMIGGHLTIKSAPGSGTMVLARIPLAGNHARRVPGR